jgi:hypothetical protein
MTPEFKGESKEFLALRPISVVGKHLCTAFLT